MFRPVIVREAPARSLPLSHTKGSKTWMPGTGPGMKEWREAVPGIRK
jgi:hypothetical protein